MTKKFKAFFIILVLLLSIPAVQLSAQTSKSQKAKTHKAHTSPASSPDNGDYYHGHKVYPGPRGGRYYINGNGKKTYI